MIQLDEEEIVRVTLTFLEKCFIRLRPNAEETMPYVVILDHVTASPKVNY